MPCGILQRKGSGGFNMHPFHFLLLLVIAEFCATYLFSHIVGFLHLNGGYKCSYKAFEIFIRASLLDPQCTISFWRWIFGEVTPSILAERNIFYFWHSLPFEMVLSGRVIRWSLSYNQIVAGNFDIHFQVTKTYSEKITWVIT